MLCKQGRWRRGGCEGRPRWKGWGGATVGEGAVVGVVDGEIDGRSTGGEGDLGVCRSPLKDSEILTISISRRRLSIGLVV